MTLTMRAAKLRGYAHPVQHRRWSWRMECVKCGTQGFPHVSKFPASEDARAHNKTVHPNALEEHLT